MKLGLYSIDKINKSSEIEFSLYESPDEMPDGMLYYTKYKFTGKDYILLLDEKLIVSKSDSYEHYKVLYKGKVGFVLKDRLGEFVE